MKPERPDPSENSGSSTSDRRAAIRSPIALTLRNADCLSPWMAKRPEAGRRVEVAPLTRRRRARARARTARPEILLLSHYFLGILVVSQRYEFGVPELVGAGPLGEINADHGLGFEPDAAFHLFRGETLAPSAG